MACGYHFSMDGLTWRILKFKSMMLMPSWMLAKMLERKPSSSQEMPARYLARAALSNEISLPFWGRSSVPFIAFIPFPAVVGKARL